MSMVDKVCHVSYGLHCQQSLPITGEHMYRADTTLFAAPVNGGAATPPGVDTAGINNIWGYAQWSVAALACFALIGCAIMAWSNNRNNESNEGVVKAGKVLAGLFAVGLIPGIVGMVSGT